MIDSELIVMGFEEFMAEGPGAEGLRQISAIMLDKGWRAVVFGGAVRDAYLGYLQGVQTTPRDIDIVVDGASTEELVSALGGGSINGFGGMRKVVGSMPYDIWPLDTTWGIKHLQITEPTFDDLLRTVFFNIDTVAVELGSFRVYDAGFTEAMRSKTLEVVLADNPFPALCVVIAVNAARKYGLSIGPKLRDWLFDFDIEAHLRAVERSHNAKYKAAIPFDPGVYRQFYTDLRHT